MNPDFSNYVKRVSFSLQLTGPQCVMLYLAYTKNDARYYSHWYNCKHALQRKGLMIFHDRLEFDPAYGKKMNASTGCFTGDKPSYTLTKEGELAAQLVIASGLEEIEDAIQKLYKFAGKDDPVKEPSE